MQGRVGVKGPVAVGGIGVVGASAGSPVDGAGIGAFVGIGSLVGRVGPIGGAVGDEGVNGPAVGLAGSVIVGSVGVLVAIGTFSEEICVGLPDIAGGELLGALVKMFCFVGAVVCKPMLIESILIMDSK